jgi:DNA polymerase-3 subunit delta
VIITLTGPNEFLIKQTLDGLVANFVKKHGAHGIERISGDAIEPSRLAELLQGVSLFAPQRLVILRDASKNKTLWDNLGDWLQQVPDETVLVIVEPTPDKRTKTYKLLQRTGELRTCNELTEPQLVRWLQNEATAGQGEIDTKTAQYLVQQVGTDQWRLWQELQKLLNRQTAITKQEIDELVEANPQATAFELLDAAMARKPDRVREIVTIIAANEDPYRFFGLLVSQVHAVAVVKYAGSKSADIIAKEAGLHPFVVRKTQASARAMTSELLKDMIESVALCDNQLKSTGADPWLLVEQCLSKIATR